MTVHAGKALIVLGVCIVIVGFLMTFNGKIPLAGKLPGDIVIRKGNLTFYLPLATSFLASVVISLIIILLNKK